MKKQVKCLAVVTVLAVTVGLTACSSSGTASVTQGQTAEGGENVQESKSEERIPITMAVWSSSSSSLQNEAAQAFNDSQDKIDFRVEMQSGDYSQYLGAKTVANDLPDLFYLNPFSDLQQYARQGYLLDLSDQPFAGRIYDSTKSGVTYDGKIYAYPSTIEYWGLFYNLDLFEQAGITEIPQTFSQLEEVCEKLKESGITPFAATYKDAWTCEQIFSGLYGALMQDDTGAWVQEMNQGSGTFNQEGVDQVFAFMDLLKENSGTNYMDADSTAGYNSFASGDAAMIFLGNFALRSAKNINPDIRVGLIPIPLTENPEESKIMYNTGVGIAVNANGEHVEEALEALTFLADTTEGVKNWNSVMLDSYGGALPSQPMTLKNVVDEPYYKTASQYLDEGKSLSKISNQLNSGAMTIIQNVVQGYFAGMADQQQTLDQLDEEILELAD